MLCAAEATPHLWAGLGARVAQVYWRLVYMAEKSLGRPPEYDPEEDAVLLNTRGEGADYTNEVLERLGKTKRTKAALASRRQMVTKDTKKPSPDALTRMQRVAELERQLKLQMAALSAEKALLRRQVEQELGLLAPEASDDDDEPPLVRR